MNSLSFFGPVTVFISFWKKSGSLYQSFALKRDLNPPPPPPLPCAWPDWRTQPRHEVMFGTKTIATELVPFGELEMARCWSLGSRITDVKKNRIFYSIFWQISLMLFKARREKRFSKVLELAIKTLKQRLLTSLDCFYCSLWTFISQREEWHSGIARSFRIGRSRV